MNPVEELIQALNEKRNIFLTGAGGTGKSYLLKALMTKYPNQFVVTSSTGISASLLMDGAMTIHSFSGIGIDSFEDHHYKDHKLWVDYSLMVYSNLNEKQTKRIKHCKRLIIDEISMISNGQLDLIDQVFRYVKSEEWESFVALSGLWEKEKEIDHTKNPMLIPFGGIQVIITGDFCQLPSIKKIKKHVISFNPFNDGLKLDTNTLIYSKLTKTEFIKLEGDEFCWKELTLEESEKLNQPDYAFESRVWKEANLKTIYLKEIKRTENKDFAEFLHRLRVGNWDNKDFFYLKKFEKNKHTHPPVKLYADNYSVDKYNNEQLALVEQPLITLKSRFRGHLTEEYKEMRKGILAPDTLELKEGCRVMILINKSEEDGLNDDEYVNGSTGVFVGMTDKLTKRDVWVKEKDPLTGEMRRFKDKRVYQVVQVRLDNGNLIELKRNSWNNGIEIWDKQLEALVYEVEFSQFPIKLCYALTSHKSQGASIDFLEIDTKNFRSPNQFYVALSRATDPSKIRVLNLKTYHIKTCKKALSFYDNLEKEMNEKRNDQ